MDPTELIAIVTGLLSPEPAPVFDALRNGGPNQAYPVVVAPCDAPDLGFEIEGQTVICGTVDVPENHDTPDGPTLSIEFAILRARSEAPFTDPVVYLHGGPGYGTLTGLGHVAAMFADHRQTRDIVTFDQRAAGLTARNLLCVESLSDNAGLVEAQTGLGATTADQAAATVALTEACVGELEAEGITLSNYNTVMNARDVRAVVQGLGYDAYNVYGISYGTRLALEVMRTSPEGVRSVVLDSVAPTTVRLYDELLAPHQDALDALVRQCAEDPGCAEAYPDFGQQIIEVAADLRDNPIPAERGAISVTEDLYLQLFLGRNTPGSFDDVTDYLPRITAELAERDTTAFDRFVAQADAGDVSPLRRIYRATVDLDADERVLAQAALQAADLMEAAQELAETALQQLETDLRTEAAGPNIAGEFSEGLQAAIEQTRNDGARTAMHASLLALLDGEQTRERLFDLVLSHVLPPHRVRLLDLVDAMTETELADAYARIIEQDQLLAGAFLTNFDLMVYACQEDFPWNSREGADAFNETVRYPFLVDQDDLRGIGSIYSGCEAFEPHLPRVDFHEPVSSDLPVMVLSGLTDTQTSWRWGPLAAETLPNAQSFLFPGAGHGVIQFSDCAQDMTVAFIHAPDQPVPDRCIASLEPDFFLPDEIMR